jgi:hypothetical protein
MSPDTPLLAGKRVLIVEEESPVAMLNEDVLRVQNPRAMWHG